MKFFTILSNIAETMYLLLLFFFWYVLFLGVFFLSIFAILWCSDGGHLFCSGTK